MDKVQIRWMHECFTRRCTEINVIIRFVETNDLCVEVPDMYCSVSGQKLRLVQVGENVVF